MDGRSRTRDGRIAAASGLCLIGLAAVVAITSRATAHANGGPLRAGSSASHAVGAVLLTIGFLAWLVATVVLVAVLWPVAIRRRRRSPEDDLVEPYRPEVYWWEKAIVLALPLALLACAVAAVVLFGRGGGTAAPATTFHTIVGSAPGVGTTSSRTPPPASPTGSSGTPLGIALVASAAVALAAATVLVVIRRRSRPQRSPLPPRAGARIASALDWSLDDLQREPDPRRAVIAAYARMERLLGAHGVRRHRWEAPLEYLRRALAGLGAGDASIAELTSLFQEARFSPHTVGEPERTRAVKLLTDLRQELDAA